MTDRDLMVIADKQASEAEVYTQGLKTLAAYHNHHLRNKTNPLKPSALHRTNFQLKHCYHYNE